MAGIALHEDVNTEKIPDPVVKPTFTGVKMRAENVNVSPSYRNNWATGQTTGTNPRDKPHTTQFAVRHMSKGSSFSKFVMPQKPSEEAERVTNIFVHDSGGNR